MTETSYATGLTPRQARSIASDVIGACRFYAVGAATGERMPFHDGDDLATAVTLRTGIGWADALACAASWAVRNGCILACPDASPDRVLDECYRAIVWGAGPGRSLDPDWANAAGTVIRMARRPDDALDLADDWLQSRAARVRPGAEDEGWPSADVAARNAAHNASMQGLTAAAELLWHFATLSGDPVGLLDQMTYALLRSDLRDDLENMEKEGVQE